MRSEKPVTVDLFVWLWDACGLVSVRRRAPHERERHPSHETAKVAGWTRIPSVPVAPGTFADWDPAARLAGLITDVGLAITTLRGETEAHTILTEAVDKAEALP